ncbi:sugar ABC transporter substrate-binding protein [Clostridiales bacterium COT073_COT-073]|nr:sugar ABC transporter substrate-binding protein [Clostridiales bacterium COT073_COT-073]
MKKRIFTLLLCFALVLGMTACGDTKKDEKKAPESNSTTEANQSMEKTEKDEPKESMTMDSVKLTVSIWDNNQKPGLEQILADFTAQTGIETEISVISWDEYWTLLASGAQGGKLPDVFWMHSNESQRYMENNMLLDLTDRIKNSQSIDMSKYPADIAELYALDGKTFGIPKDIDTIALWYNKTMFDEAGVKYPDDSWTWDDFVEAAKKLTKEDGSQYGCVIAVDNNQAGYYNMIYDYGGYVISPDKKKSGYDDPNTLKGMSVISRLLEAKAMPDLQTVSENKTDVLMQSGKVAMATQGSWMIAAFKDNEYMVNNFDVAVLPKSEDGKRISIYNGLGWVAAANTEHPEQAWRLLEYLGSKEAQIKQADLGVTMSAYEGTSGNWIKSTDKFNLKAHLDMTKDMVIRPYSKKTVIWENLSIDKLKPVWEGKVDMETALKELATEMNTILSEE